MNESYEVLRSAIERVGAKKVAANLGLSMSLIYKWCQKPPDDEDFMASGAANPLDRLRLIYELTGDEAVIDWMCGCAGGYLVKDLPHKDAGEAQMFFQIQCLIKEFSEALDAISKSYENGHRITIEESKRIRKEWNDLKRIGESFVRACESGEYDKKV